MTLFGAVLLVQLMAVLPGGGVAAEPVTLLEPLPPPPSALAPFVAPEPLNPTAVSPPAPIPSTPAFSPLLRIPEPRPISRKERIAWTSLSFSTHAAAAFDARTTRLLLHRYAGRELNPFLLPVAGSDAGLFAATQLGASGANYIGWRMLHSQRRWMRKLWWLPQTLSFAGSLFGGFHNLNEIHRVQNGGFR